MNKNKILAIVGSLRKESFNLQLAKEVKKLIGDRADLEILEYSDIPFMNQDIEYPTPQSIQRVREKVKNADGVWFFCPEYNYSISGVLKNLIDWLSRPISKTEGQVLSKKPATISGITPGMTGTNCAQSHLVSLISCLNMKVMNYPRLTIPNAFDEVDSSGKLVLNKSKSFVEKQVESYLQFLEVEKAK